LQLSNGKSNPRSRVEAVRRLSPSQANQLAWVSLGSNLGRSRAIIRKAMDTLERFSAAPLVRSSLRRTAPVDCPPGSPSFCNALVGLSPKPGETADSLLNKLQALEHRFGRRRSGLRNEPRNLDLDLIAFRRQRRRSPRLVLPHPRAHLRSFVLDPFVELAPNYVLPGRRKTVRQLRQQMPLYKP
jgi:2-amino-4-hydroxy-6-hydroxymethyldihydropteridine diphosphokinase